MSVNEDADHLMVLDMIKEDASKAMRDLGHDDNDTVYKVLREMTAAIKDVAAAIRERKEE